MHAENRMMHELKTNTHRGTIFLGGIMLYAVHKSGSLRTDFIQQQLKFAARQLFVHGPPVNTTGAMVRKRFNAGGIISEALTGLPAIFKYGVPALDNAKHISLN